MGFRAFTGVFGAVSILAAAASAAATGVLESPEANESGIGFISGWHCTGKVIEIQVDNGPMIKAGSGTVRPDTAPVCGHSDTGFGLTYNYNVHPPGLHTFSIYADGVLFAKRLVTIFNFGAEYLQGVSASCLVDDFPVRGKTAIVSWSENKQNFSITSIVNRGAAETMPDAQAGGTARTSVVETNCYNYDLPLEPSDFDEGPARATVTAEVAAGTLTVDLFTSSDRHCTVTGPLSGHYPFWFAAIDMSRSNLSCLGSAAWDGGTLSVHEHRPGWPSFGNESLMLVALRVTATPSGNSCPRQWLSFHGASTPRY